MVSFIGLPWSWCHFTVIDIPSNGDSGLNGSLLRYWGWLLPSSFWLIPGDCVAPQTQGRRCKRPGLWLMEVECSLTNWSCHLRTERPVQVCEPCLWMHGSSLCICGCRVNMRVCISSIKNKLGAGEIAQPWKSLCWANGRSKFNPQYAHKKVGVVSEVKTSS